MTPTVTPPSPFTIVVEGNIGAGKTTFLQQFMVDKKDKNLVQVYAEPVDKWRDVQGKEGSIAENKQLNSFYIWLGDNLLSLLYEDPKRWSLLLQTYIQLTMLQQHLQPCQAQVKVMERSLLRQRFYYFPDTYLIMIFSICIAVLDIALWRISIPKVWCPMRNIRFCPNGSISSWPRLLWVMHSELISLSIFALIQRYLLDFEWQFM